MFLSIIRDGQKMLARPIRASGIHLLCEILAGGPSSQVTLVGIDNVEDREAYKSAWLSCGGEQLFTEDGKPFDPFS